MVGIEAGEGGKEGDCGCGKVHDEMRDCLGDGDDGWCRWGLGWVGGSRFFGADCYAVFVHSVEMEELVGGVFYEGMAILVEGTDK